MKLLFFLGVGRNIIRNGMIISMSRLSRWCHHQTWGFQGFFLGCRSSKSPIWILWLLKYGGIDEQRAWLLTKPYLSFTSEWSIISFNAIRMVKSSSIFVDFCKFLKLDHVEHFHFQHLDVSFTDPSCNGHRNQVTLCILWASGKRIFSTVDVVSGTCQKETLNIWGKNPCFHQNIQGFLRKKTIG